MEVGNWTIELGAGVGAKKVSADPPLKKSLRAADLISAGGISLVPDELCGTSTAGVSKKIF